MRLWRAGYCGVAISQNSSGTQRIPPSQRLLRQDETLRDGFIHRRDRVLAAGITYEERLTEMEPARIQSSTGLNDVVEQRRAIGNYKQHLPETTCVHLDLPTGCLQVCTASISFAIDASTRCGITFNKLTIH